MTRIILISCSDKKLQHKTKARELYQGDFFKKSLAYAEKIIKADNIFILSAKHGLLPLDKEIEPYNVTLCYLSPKQLAKKPDTKVLSVKERRDWAVKVLNQLREVVDLERDEIIFLAGECYRKDLIPSIKRSSIPMKGLHQGEQKQFLKRRLE